VWPVRVILGRGGLREQGPLSVLRCHESQFPGRSWSAGGILGAIENLVLVLGRKLVRWYLLRRRLWRRRVRALVGTAQMVYLLLARRERTQDAEASVAGWRNRSGIGADCIVGPASEVTRIDVPEVRRKENNVN